MTRLRLIWMFIVCLSCSMCIGIANGQDAITDVGAATIKGEIVDASPEQKTIVRATVMAVDVSTATVKGEIVDASPEQKPIADVTVKIVNPANGNEYIVTTDKDGAYEKTGLQQGRYTIIVSKRGYGDRIIGSKVVAAGGEIFEIIKMRKKDNIITFFQRGMFGWILVVSFTIGFLLAILALFKSLRRSNV